MMGYNSQTSLDEQLEQLIEKYDNKAASGYYTSITAASAAYSPNTGSGYTEIRLGDLKKARCAAYHPCSNESTALGLNNTVALSGQLDFFDNSNNSQQTVAPGDRVTFTDTYKLIEPQPVQNELDFSISTKDKILNFIFDYIPDGVNFKSKIKPVWEWLSYSVVFLSIVLIILIAVGAYLY